jgi:MoaA/NifB/PqqE/SkfB family radical SAM enzyme
MPRLNHKPFEKLIFKPLAEQVQAWNEASPERRIAVFGCPPENSTTKEIVRGKVAIPGAGEPFHPRNRALVLALIRSANACGLHMTIFTTGHWIDEALAAELVPLDVVLLVKRNSSKRDVQNALVGMPADHSFFEKREAALRLLIDLGFNKPFGKPGSADYQETRLGVVTSIMRQNIDELGDLLRFARKNNIIFDCDTILERGRGGICRQRLTDEMTEEGFKILQRLDKREFQREWEISSTYVGTACDRYRHHLYVDRRGFIYPCVGCMADEEHNIDPIILGNIKEGPHALIEAWHSPIMAKVIRPWHYEGPCKNCTKPEKGVCFSCLGRFRDSLRTLTRDSTEPIFTIGCWNQSRRRGKHTSA